MYAFQASFLPAGSCFAEIAALYAGQETKSAWSYGLVCRVMETGGELPCML